MFSCHKTNAMHEVIEAAWGTGDAAWIQPISRAEVHHVRHSFLADKDKTAAVVKRCMTIRVLNGFIHLAVQCRHLITKLTISRHDTESCDILFRLKLFIIDGTK